jgi:FtsP/CotA-like multicopper oxidase with cupredoxin domain
MPQRRRLPHPVDVSRSHPVARATVATAAIVALLATVGLRAPARPGVTVDAFRTPPLLANASSRPGVVEVTIVAEGGRLDLVPGPRTPGYAYNGSVPGPTLDVREGDRLIVHFRNRLPEATSIHWHGLHTPADMDGGPMRAVPPCGRYEYAFTIPMGSAGTYWYHPHPDVRTGHQIAMGLYGAIIVRPRIDPIPSAVTERLIILADNRVLPDGTLDFPARASAAGMVDEVNGREGNLLLVNGAVMPTIAIRPGEVQRWRIINASAARVYRLALPGHTMLHVGSAGGLFERPLAVTEIVVANSERVELLVRGTGAPRTTTALQALPYDRYVPQTRPANWDSTRTLRYSDEPPADPVAIPATLRVVPPIDTSRARTTRVMVMSQGMINGHVMNMHRADFDTRLGATEIWQLENLVGMDHPFHLHGFEFQVLDRGGVPEPYRSWKDVVNVRKHETVRFVVRYDDFAGSWMYHCHILDHEDHGMMGFFQVH